MWQRVVVLATVLTATVLSTGCANYRAVSDFSHETTRMTGAVKGEFVALETLCTQQAELVLVVNNIPGDGPLAQCERYQRAQGRFAAVTVDVLDAYADALDDLADRRAFDVSPEMRSLGSKVRALNDGAGNDLMPEGSANALTRVSDLIVQVMASRKRDDAVRHLVAATPDLTVMGNALKSFFVSTGASRPPYGNFVAVITSSTASTQQILQSQPMRKAEPIRTAELLRALRVRQKLLDRRSGTGADSVPSRIGAAIDAWLQAVDQFSRDALDPDSREFADRLRTLRSATRVAQDAVVDRGTTEAR